MEFKTKKELYEYIWNNRPHVSEVSGLPLLYPNHFQFHWQFAHVLNHGRYPHYKFNPDNIMLMLPEEHANQDSYTKFKEKQLELTREYYKKYYNKEYD